MIPLSQALKVMSASCGPLKGFFANLPFHGGSSTVATLHRPGVIKSPDCTRVSPTLLEQQCQFVEILLFDPKTT